MFRIDQIVSSARLRKDFYLIARHLDGQPQALLITRKRGEALVLVNGSIFQDLATSHFESMMEKEREGLPIAGPI